MKGNKETNELYSASLEVLHHARNGDGSLSKTTSQTALCRLEGAVKDYARHVIERDFDRASQNISAKTYREGETTTWLKDTLKARVADWFWQNAERVSNAVNYEGDHERWVDILFEDIPELRPTNEGG